MTVDDIAARMFVIASVYRRLSPILWREITRFQVGHGVSDGALYTVFAERLDMEIFRSPRQLEHAGLTANVYPLTRGLLDAAIDSRADESDEPFEGNQSGVAIHPLRFRRSTPQRMALRCSGLRVAAGQRHP